MKSVYSWQLRSVLSAFGLLVLTQVVILGLGVTLVLGYYTRAELSRLETLASTVLLEGPTAADESSVTGPFFVYSADREFVYSNRGRGRSIDEGAYRPIEWNGSVIGFFYAEEFSFLSNVTNRYFLASIGLLLAGSLVIGVLIAGVIATRAARTVSAAVGSLLADLDSLRALQPTASRAFPIRELASISARLHEVSEMLASEDDYKRRWMQDISHDLRTPLSGLRGQLEGMRDGVLEPSADRFGRTLRDVARLEEMVGSISELHSIERAGHPEIEVISSRKLLGELVSAFETRLRDRGARITTDAKAPYLWANRALILRALGNIVGNSLVHGGSGVSIHAEIRDTADGEMTAIEIRNDGPCIPEEHLGRVFQRFFRGEFARSTSGTGLGLSIAQEIAVRHDGTISVRNLSPRGVAFTVKLPALPDEIRSSNE